MIEEQAIVVGIERDQALLEIVRNKPCGLCGQTRGCGISIWGRLLGHRNSVFRAANQINARVGDSVVVGVDEKALLAGSLAVYGAPLFLLLAGAGMGSYLAPPQGSVDAYALVGAFAGLVIALLWLRAHAAGRAPDARFRPVILRPTAASATLQVCQRGE
ncbi:MAG TPA: SoxR reducing system RseC family protein [Methylophilaceae bacterium]|nr:SoxR reducing system RseC family protein [Methylophilaceae bacterium]